MSKYQISKRHSLESSSATPMLALTGGLSVCSGGGKSDPGGSVGGRGPNSLPDPIRAAGVADATLPFDHVVVVQENQSFDNYLGMLAQRGQPQADGFRVFPRSDLASV